MLIMRIVPENIFSRAKIRLIWGPTYLKYVLVSGNSFAFYIPTSLTKVERLLLFRLGLQTMKSPVFVEIGGYLGASAYFLAAAAAKRGGLVYCVDTWKNDAMSEGPRDTWSEFLSNTYDYRKYIRAIRGTSVATASKFEGIIDLLFIDGEHSYNGCRSDVEAWLPKVREGGVVVFHDYTWAEGVQRTIDEYIRPIETKKGMVVQNTYWTRISNNCRAKRDDHRLLKRSDKKEISFARF